MPLTGTEAALTAEIAAKIVEKAGNVSNIAEVNNFAAAIAEALIPHLVANIEVIVSGVTAGGDSAVGVIE